MPNLKLGMVLQVFDRATGPLKGLSRSAGSTRSAIARLGEQSAQAGQLAALRSGLGATASKLDVSRRKTSELGREIKRKDDPSAKLRREFERSQRSTVKLAQAHGRQKRELAELSRKLRDAGVDTRRLEGEQDRLARSSDRLARRLQRQGQSARAPSGGGFGRGFLGGLAGSAGEAGRPAQGDGRFGARVQARRTPVRSSARRSSDPRAGSWACRRVGHRLSGGGYATVVQCDSSA